MACALTSSRTLACKDSVGGIKTVYFTELANKNTLASVTDGTISTFTLTTGKRFWQYDLIKETSNFKETWTTSDQNGTLFYQTDLNIILNKGDATTRNQIKLLAQNDLMVIILDRNGVYWLMGEVNGAFLLPSDFDSGTAMGDRNGYNLKFQAKETNAMQTVTSSLITTLLSPA